MFKRIAFSLLFLLLNFAPFSVTAKLVTVYSLKDLQILEAESNYQEFFQHALDLRPSLRTKEYRHLVDSMATAFAQALSKKKLIEEKEFSMLSEVLALPGQKTNEEFKRLRGQIGVNYLKEKTKIEDTRHRILKFWQEDPQDFELGFKLAALYEKNVTAEYDKQSWAFYEEAAKSEVADIYCKRPQLQQAAANYLNYKFNDAHLNLRNLISNIMHAACWKELKVSLKQALTTVSPEFAMNLYQLLKIDNGLTSEEKEYFSFVYIINGPINGDTFNEAWNILAELKNNNQKRQLLLERLKLSGHLPDNILGSYDETRKKVIASYIQKNVPEYFDFYTRECLSFLKGEKHFPAGNPTLHCRELIELNEKERANLVDPILVLQYKNAVKI